MAFYNEFPGTRFYDGDLRWILEQVRQLLDSMEQLGDDVEELAEYVKTYFDNLDLTAEVRKILEEYEQSGKLEDIIRSIIYDYEAYKAIGAVAGQSETVSIGFLGDSITYGYRPGTDNEQSATNYPARVKAIAGDAVGICYNYGVSGAASNAWEGQYSQAMADGCKIVSFMFGHNDFRLGYSVQHVINSAKAFIDRALSEDITPVVCSTNPYFSTQANRLNKTSELAEGLRALCSTRGVCYIPVYECGKMLMESGKVNVITLTPDGVHWNSYRPIGDIWAAYALPFLVHTGAGSIIAWRDNGVSSINAAIATLSTSTQLGVFQGCRALNLKANSIVQIKFYRDRAFTLETSTADFAASGLVTWRITGHPAAGFLDTPCGAGGSATCQIDYKVSLPSFDNISEITHKQLFDGRRFPPGVYTLELYALERGNVPEPYIPLLYLLSLDVVPV